MKSVRLLFLCCILVISVRTRAQEAILGVSHTALSNLPDTVAYNATDTVQLWIYNTGSVAFTGIIYIYNSTGTGGIDSIPNQGGSIQYTPGVDTIAPGDSVYKMLFFQFGGSQFPPGAPSGIVIWPVAGSDEAITLDSASKVVYVLGNTNGIVKLAGDNLKVYMDGNELYIKSQGLIMPMCVRIFDVSGALLQDREVSSGFAILPMQQYACGIYLAEVILPDNERLVYKVVK